MARLCLISPRRHQGIIVPLAAKGVTEAPHGIRHKPQIDEGAEMNEIHATRMLELEFDLMHLVAMPIALAGCFASRQCKACSSMGTRIIKDLLYQGRYHVPC
jgi:hypothetical protein